MAARCLLYFADLALAVPPGEKGKGFEIHWFMLPDCKSGRTERAENPAEREGGLVQGCSKVSYRAVRGSSRAGGLAQAEWRAYARLHEESEWKME